MSTLTLQLSDALARRLDAASAARRIPRDQLAREALENALASQAVAFGEDGPSLYDVMQDAVGCVASGAGDLATNPKHMEGFGQWRK
jgi:hypothetical protein